MLASLLGLSKSVGVLQIKAASAQSEAQSEMVLTCAHDLGPFYAHVKDGRWIRSTPVERNLPVGHNAYSVRNRLYAANRIRYPMKRADFDPSNRNTQNRGKSQYVRISWDEAIDIVASELARAKNTYGPSSVLASPVGHQWVGQMNNVTGNMGAPFEWFSAGWGSRFFSLYGGCTVVAGDTSWTGWDGGGPEIFGFGGLGFYIGQVTNSFGDIIANCKLYIFWSTDPAVRSYITYHQNIFLKQLKDAGIRLIAIDPHQNDTAAVYADKWIPINPHTDEAMMAAIAYVWISENLLDEAFINSHAVGYLQFKDYILGNSDGIPKKPEWAEAITGVEAGTIKALAEEWASKPTFIDCFAAGANRRDNAANWTRWLVTLQTISGNLGRPGGGVGQLAFSVSPADMPRFGGIPPVPNPISQNIRHGFFSQAVEEGSSTFTSVNWATGEIRNVNYPSPGLSEIHLVAFLSGTGFFLNQIPGTNDHIKAIQNPKIEFVYSHSAWWEITPKFSDVILPVRHIGEREDLTSWENFLVFMNKVAEPVPEAKNDFDIFVALADKLGFKDALTQGKDYNGWLQSIYAAANLSMTFDQFKATGFVKYTPPPQVAQVPLKGFHDDPANHKLNTPSGKVEIFSQRIVDFFGPNVTNPPPFPKYLPSPEDSDATLAAKYPLILKSSHAKFARHSQWQNLSWQKDESQMTSGDYPEMRINPVDAAPRGLKTGDVARVFNDRGAILRGVRVTERIIPGTVVVWEGGWYTPQQPGVVGALDLGGNPNCLISGRQPDPLCDGMIDNARVEVVKWEGS